MWFIQVSFIANWLLILALPRLISSSAADTITALPLNLCIMSYVFMILISVFLIAFGFRWMRLTMATRLLFLRSFGHDCIGKLTTL